MSSSKRIFQFGPETNGNSPVIFEWSRDSSYIAVATDNRLVYILDKRGKRVQEVTLPTKGRILTLDWDKENQYLAILQEDLNFVTLWTPLTTNTLEQIETDTPKAKASWLKWSHTHSTLAFGTDKGTVIFYNRKTKKKIPTMGKHTKKVICGGWNNEGLLITGGEDKLITVSNHTSETVFESFAVKSEPKGLKWVLPKFEDQNSKQTTFSTVLNNKTLLLHEVGQTNKPPIELMMEAKYGKVTDYCPFGDGYIVMGFTEGYYAHLSTFSKQIKDEIFSERLFNAPLEAICTNNSIYKMAAAGENKIKIISLTDWKEIKSESIDLPKNSGKVNKISWSETGQTLIVSTEKGQLFGFLTSSISLFASSNELITILTSFTEANIMSSSSKNKGKVICTVNLPTQPQAIFVGPNHLGMKLGNTVRVFQWNKDRNIIDGGKQILEKDYNFNIKKALLNDQYLALLTQSNKICLTSVSGKEEDTIIPSQGQINQFTITKHFIILLDSTSKLRLYHIEDKSFIMEYKAESPIVKIYPNKIGTRILLLHQNGELNMISTNTEVINHVKLVSDRVDNVLWDNDNPNEFVILYGDKVYSYIINKNNIFGNVVQPVSEILAVEKVEHEDGEPCSTKVDKNILSLVGGHIYSMGQTGQIGLTVLTSHAFLGSYRFEADSQEGHLRYFFQNISLKRFGNCLIAAKFLDVELIYDALGRKALQNLELEIALKAFQMGKNLSMVLTIQEFFHENERSLLTGNIAMVLGKYDIAQEHYLKSSEPLNALEMRSDIQDWLIASTLAKKIAPHQQSFINRRLAVKTESQGNNTEALKLFERSVLRGDEKAVEKAIADKHNIQCFAGIARTSIKLGDVQRGFSVARELKDTALLIDIAVVCENMKQYLEAAELYEKGEQYEKAASLYLQQKMYKQAAPFMQKIKSPKLLIQYGKAKESEGAFKEAESAYEKAEAWEDVVRINLNNLDNIEKAKNILRNKCPTATVAMMVTSYCERRGLWKDTIEFLIMENRKETAFSMAKEHNEMDHYVTCLTECGHEERIEIARYYIMKSQWGKAAKQYELANEPSEALKLYIKAGNSQIPSMLQLASINKSNQNLIQELLDYLLGETDGEPKDPIYTYELYKILQNFKNAAKIAVTIATQDQENGEYKKAHEMLFKAYQDIKKTGAVIPLELEKKLIILHSYILVFKRIIKINQHQDAAYLLSRVAKNLSQFPSHAVNILTTVVVEAMRSELRGLAYTWAVQLVREEYRPNIPKNYRDRIQNLARRPVKQQNVEPKTPCPFCKEPVPQFQTECSKCLNSIPFCIASGKHIIAEQLAYCSKCSFPTNISYMKKLLQGQDVEKTCPMCGVQIGVNDIKFIGEAGVAGLKNTPKDLKEKEKQEEEDDDYY